MTKETETSRKVSLSAFIATLPRWVVISISVALLVMIGLLDYVTGPNISFAVFYLLPVVLVAWYINTPLGILMSCISATIWFGVNFSIQYARHLDIAISLWNSLTRLGFFLIVISALHSLHRALERERAFARTDILTGALNSRAFLEMAELERQRAMRYHHPLTMIYIDADNFKTVNDQWGHQTGDEVLRRIVGVLQNHLRSTDITARLGGDEFAVLLPEASPEAAQTTARKLRIHLLEAMEQGHWPVTFSIGVLTFLKPPDTVDAMVAEADMLMYSVKYSGKNAMKYEIAVTSTPEG